MSNILIISLIGCPLIGIVIYVLSRLVRNAHAKALVEAQKLLEDLETEGQLWTQAIKERQKKISEALRHVTLGDNWKSPQGKKELIKALYGEKVPKYLFYTFPRDVKITDEELVEGLEEMWRPLYLSRPSAEDFGAFDSGYKNLGLVLRARKPPKVLPELKYRGKTLPLYQVGESEWFQNRTSKVIDFRDLYDRNNQ